MKNKKLMIGFIIVFFVIILLPFIFMNRKPNAISSKENRYLAPEPLSAITDTRYADAVDNYVNDRAGFRNEFVNLNGFIDYECFKQSPSDNAIIGKNGWLFYGSTEDGEHIPQYLGTCQYTDEQLETIKNNMVATENYLKERNCDFIVFIAPNKERVYSEYMPDKYQKIRRQDTCNTEQVIDYLRKNTDIKIVYPYDELISFKEENPDKPVYYHLDTHWNHLGGYIGASALLNEMGIHIPSAEEEVFTSKELQSGDLKNMMSYDGVTMNDIDYIPKNYPDKNTKVSNEDFYGQWIYQNSGKDSRKVFLLRDSFTSLMSDVLGSEFNDINMCHYESFDQSLVEKEKPDVFILETVERYDDRLLSFCLDDEQDNQ